MSKLYKGYEAGKQIFGAVKKLLKGEKQKTTGTEVIKSVKPTFPKTKMSQALRDVKITALKTKGSIKKGSQDFDRDIQKVKSKIGQTMQKLKGEPVTKSGVSKGKDLREKKMGGGFMGKRMGYKKGTSKPYFLDLDKDGNTSEPMKQAAKQAKKK